MDEKPHRTLRHQAPLQQHCNRGAIDSVINDFCATRIVTQPSYTARKRLSCTLLAADDLQFALVSKVFASSASLDRC